MMSSHRRYDMSRARWDSGASTDGGGEEADGRGRRRRRTRSTSADGRQQHGQSTAAAKRPSLRRCSPDSDGDAAERCAGIEGGTVVYDEADSGGGDDAAAANRRRRQEELQRPRPLPPRAMPPASRVSAPVRGPFANLQLNADADEKIMRLRKRAMALGKFKVLTLSDGRALEETSEFRFAVRHGQAAAAAAGAKFSVVYAKLPRGFEASNWPRTRYSLLRAQFPGIGERFIIAWTTLEGDVNVDRMVKLYDIASVQSHEIDCGCHSPKSPWFGLIDPRRVETPRNRVHFDANMFWTVGLLYKHFRTCGVESWDRELADLAREFSGEQRSQDLRVTLNYRRAEIKLCSEELSGRSSRFLDVSHPPPEVATARRDRRVNPPLLPPANAAAPDSGLPSFNVPPPQPPQTQENNSLVAAAATHASAAAEQVSTCDPCVASAIDPVVDSSGSAIPVLTTTAAAAAAAAAPNGEDPRTQLQPSRLHNELSLPSALSPPPTPHPAAAFSPWRPSPPPRAEAPRPPKHVAVIGARYTGCVVDWRGNYGFLTCNFIPTRIFLHASNILGEGGVSELPLGTSVNFRLLYDDTKGYQAEEAKLFI